MNWTNAIVNVRSDRYVGVAVVQAFNDDDTVTVLNEMTGGEYRVEKDAIDLVPMTEQPVEWIAHQLMEAWQPFICRLAQHIAERLRVYGRFGEPEQTEAVLRSYLDEPAKAFRELCQRRV